MTSPVLKPSWLVTNGNSSVVVQSFDLDHIVGGASDITRDITSVTAHGIIAHGNGTHIERRLSRLPRERDLHVIPFFLPSSIWRVRPSSSKTSSLLTSTSKPVSKVYMTSPTPA